MHMPMRMARQPCLDPAGLFGDVRQENSPPDCFVIRLACPWRHTRLTFGYLAVDLFQDVQKLGREMVSTAFPDHHAGGDIECGKERHRPVTHKGLDPPLGHARRHRQDRLLPIGRLGLDSHPPIKGAVRR